MPSLFDAPSEASGSDDRSESTSTNCGSSTTDESTNLSSGSGIEGIIGSNVEGICIEEPLQCDNFTMYDMSAENSELLYESSELSVYQTLAMLFNWFCSYPSVSKECFNRLLYLLHSFLLPTGNKLPMSYAKARVIIKDSLVPIKCYDCCVNDCIIYRNSAKGDFEGLNHCPSCSAPRYKPNTSIAQKQFKYVPIGPRLKRMFSNKKISELIQSHLNENAMQQPQQVVSDLHQSKTWKSMYATNGLYSRVTLVVFLLVCVLMVPTPFPRKKFLIPCGQLCYPS